ncbi:MAG: DUF4230 domain-containing protein [Bacteroidetes bacterium]|nr:DUF4230 domain-containing protein [Bacteroidota bacterium]
MKKYFFWILILGMQLAACKSDKAVETAVYKIKELGQLSTSEYTLSKVLQLNDKGEWFKIGDRKILISCQAKAKAGVDLRKLDISEVELEKGYIKIGIPSIELMSFEMIPESVSTEMSEVTGFRSSFTQEEKNKILRQGEDNIRKNLARTGLYEDAHKNTVLFIEKFYQDLGFTKIDVYAQKSIL